MSRRNMDEERRRLERAAVTGDPDAAKRLFVLRLRAGEVNQDAATLAAILGREDALEVVGSQHETFVLGADVGMGRIFDLKPGDRIGHGPAFHHLTMLGQRLTAMWALDTALRAIDAGQNPDRPRDMLLMQSLLDWIFEESDEALRVVESSRQTLEQLVDHDGPDASSTRARVMIHALGAATCWHGPSSASAASAVMAAIEAADLAARVALEEPERDDEAPVVTDHRTDQARRAEQRAQRQSLARIVLLEDQPHDDEGRLKRVMNPRRNGDVDLRALEREVGGLISRDEIDEDEPHEAAVRLMGAYLRTAGTIDDAGDRFVEFVVRAMGIDQAGIEAARRRADQDLTVARRGGVTGPDFDLLVALKREADDRAHGIADDMVRVVSIASSTAAVLEQGAGLTPPDFGVYHYVFQEVGEFDRHGPPYPWVRPRSFEGINMVDLPNATEAPVGCLLIEKGGYWPGHIRDGASTVSIAGLPRSVNPDVLIAAVTAAESHGVEASWWLLKKVKQAALVSHSYGGFSNDQTENTLLIQRRTEADREDEDELRQQWNAEDVESCGRLMAGAWRFVTGEGAYGAVLVVQRRDIVMRTVGRGAVLSNKVGDELYRWLDEQPTLPEAIADLERQGLIRVGR